MPLIATPRVGSAWPSSWSAGEAGAEFDGPAPADAHKQTIAPPAHLCVQLVGAPLQPVDAATVGLQLPCGALGVRATGVDSELPKGVI